MNPYLEEIAARGIGAFLGNGAGLSMGLHDVGGERVPVVVSDGRGGKPAFAAPRAHYLDYPIHEIARGSRRWTVSRLEWALSPLGILFHWGDLDRVVYVNHWLLVGGPPLGLEREALVRLVEDLVREHPRCALVFSGIVPALHPETAASLAAVGARAVQSRTVHLLDPVRPLHGHALRHVRSTRNADRAIHLANEDRRIRDPDVLREHAPRMAALYASLYLEKHSAALNPRYLTSFFELALRSGVFSATGWLRAGALDAFNLQLVTHGVVGWSTCGVDPTAPRSRGLFRLVAHEDVVSAQAGGLQVNWGGGNADFKRWRGALPTLEYDFVYDRHLGLRRRLPWAVLGRLRSWRAQPDSQRPGSGAAGGRRT